MNKWNEIRDFYRVRTPEILAQRKDEWALDPYEWDEGRGMIRFTPIETWLWYDLRAASAIVYPQYPVGNVFVDFANPKAKVAIECDGAAYHLDKAKDKARDDRLSALGWTVYRITGSQCRTDMDEETGAPGFARAFVEQICDWHGIRRQTNESGWLSIGDAMHQQHARLQTRWAAA